MKKQFPFTGFYVSDRIDVHLQGNLEFKNDHEFQAHLRDSGSPSPTRTWHGFARYNLTPDSMRIVDCHSRATQGKIIYILNAENTGSRDIAGRYSGFKYELLEPIAFTSNGNAFMQGFKPETLAFKSRVRAELTLLEALVRK